MSSIPDIKWEDVAIDNSVEPQTLEGLFNALFLKDVKNSEQKNSDIKPFDD